MNFEDPDSLVVVLYSITQHVERIHEMVSSKEDPRAVSAMAIYGLGCVDTIALLNKEFRELRAAATSDEDNDVQAFIAAAKCLYDWMSKKGMLKKSIPI